MMSSDHSTQTRLVNNSSIESCHAISYLCSLAFHCTKGVALLLQPILSLLQWYTLNDVKSGRVHLILEWVPTVSHSDTLDQVGLYLCLWPTSFNLIDLNQTFFKHLDCWIVSFQPAHYSYCSIIIRPNWLLSMLQVLQLQSLQSYQNKAVPAAALLFVHIERAHSLPVSHLQFIHILWRS